MVRFLQKFNDVLGAGQSMVLDQVVSYRAMAALYRAGVAVIRSLEILAAQTEHPRLRKAFNGIVRYIEGGQTMADAMRLYPRVFPEMYIHLIEVGEKSGNMEVMLERLAQHAEKANSAAMKLRSALVYPAFVFVLCLALLILAPAFTFKGIFQLLTDLHVELPLITKFMIWGSNLLNSWAFWPIAVGFIAVVYLVFDRIQKDQNLKRFVQACALKLPAIGDALRAAEVSTFCRTLSTMYASGVPILDAVDLAGRSSTNLLLREAARDIKNDVASGKTLSDAVQCTGFFPPMSIHLLAVGDETGALDRMLDRVAEISEEHVDRALEAATAALEPMVLLFVGVVVGFVVIGTMAPLLKVVQSL
ncbi:MAG: type II secretion system F family protein [Candidatus Xenobia bacterium]